MRRTALALLAPVAFTLALGACGDGDGGVDLEVEAAEDAFAVASAVVDLTLGAGQDGLGTFTGFPAPGPARASAPVDVTWTFDGPCPLGGTLEADMDVTGTVDTSTGASDLTLVVEETFAGCAVRHAATGRTLTLDGAPGVSMTLNAVRDGAGAMVVDGSYAGVVAWASDGRSGTCALDLAFAAEMVDGSSRGDGRLTGTACGVPVDRSWPAG